MSRKTKLILSVLLPAITINILEKIKVTIDLFMMSSYGAHYISAIGISVLFLTFIFEFSVFAKVGLNIISSKKIGEREYAVIPKMIFMSFILYVAIALFLAFSKDYMLYELFPLVANSDEIGEVANNYISPIIYAIIFFFIKVTLSTILVILKKPMIFIKVSLIGFALNVVLNYILINGIFLGAPLYEFGAGLSTAIIFVFEAVVYSYIFLTHPKIREKIDIKKIGLERESFKRVLKIGASSLVITFSYIFSMTVISYFIARYSEIEFAAFNLAREFTIVIFIFSISFQSPFMVFVAKYTAAKEYKIANEFIRRIKKLLITTVIILVAFILIFSNFMLHIFTDDTRIIDEAAMIINIMVAPMLFLVFAQLYNGMLQIMEQNRALMALHLFAIIFIRLVPITFFYLYGYPPIYIYSTMAAEVLIKSFLSAVLFKRFNQKQNNKFQV